MDKPIKDYGMRICMPGALGEPIARAAEAFKTTPSGLARALLEEFVKAHAEHKELVAWPPQFAHYDMPASTHAFRAKPSEADQNKPPLYERRAARPALIAADPKPSRRIPTLSKSASTSRED
jgi:hypothetical protein